MPGITINYTAHTTSRLTYVPLKNSALTSPPNSTETYKLLDQQAADVDMPKKSTLCRIMLYSHNENIITQEDQSLSLSITHIHARLLSLHSPSPFSNEVVTSRDVQFCSQLSFIDGL